MRYIATVAVAWFAIAALAADPAIDGPTTVKQHKLVKLSPTGVESKNAGYIWDVHPFGVVDSDERPDGKLIFTAPPGTYTVTLRVVDFDTKRISTARSTVTIEGVAPVPPPPGPTPVPPGPDGRLGLIKVSRDGIAKVSSTTRDTDAKNLAEVYRSIASAVAAGGIPVNLNMILAEVRIKAGTAVDAATWKPWGDAISSKLIELHNGKKLATKSDIVDALNEIAEGLAS